MGTDIEAYMCLLLHTDYMNNLLLYNKKDITTILDVAEAVKVMEHFERFETVDEIKKIKNIHIQMAIKEIEENNKNT